jgi:hypothetical protein
MSTTQEDLLQQVQELRAEAEKAGLVASDQWASLDAVWKGPDVDLEQIAVIGEETLEAVRRACAEGKADTNLLTKALELAKLILPAALMAH